MYQAPLAGYLPKGRLPARKWVRVTVPWDAFSGLKPKTVQMHSIWLKVRRLHSGVAARLVECALNEYIQCHGVLTSPGQTLA